MRLLAVLFVLLLPWTAQAGLCERVNSIRDWMRIPQVSCGQDPLLQEILGVEMKDGKANRTSLLYPSVDFTVWTGRSVAQKIGGCSYRTEPEDSVDAIYAAEQQYPPSIQKRTGMFDRSVREIGYAVREISGHRIILIRVRKAGYNRGHQGYKIVR